MWGIRLAFSGLDGLGFSSWGCQHRHHGRRAIWIGAVLHDNGQETDSFWGLTFTMIKAWATGLYPVNCRCYGGEDAARRWGWLILGCLAERDQHEMVAAGDIEILHGIELFFQCAFLS